MDKKKAIIDFKRFIKWNDKEAKDRLIASKMLIPIPKEMIHAFHTPDDCWKCAYEAGGIMGIYYMLYRKWKEKRDGGVYK